MDKAHYGKKHPKFLNITKENKKLIDNFIMKRIKLYGDKEESTPKSKRKNIERFANFLSRKSLKDVTKEDTESFFTEVYMATSTRNMTGSQIIQFYRDLYELEHNERPKCMRWFKNQKTKRANKDIYDRNKSYITRKEYDALIKKCRFDCERALWEAFYLTGARPIDLENMTIKDVIEEDGKITVVLPTSKTDPRRIPLPEDSPNLMRWVGNQPLKDNPDAPLWLSNTYRTMNEKLKRESYDGMLKATCKRAKIKKLTPKCFRKTRATMYFEDTTKKDGVKYYKWNDKEIGMIFGWTPETVVNRRQEYDLTGFEDLKNKIFEQTLKTESYDSIKRNRDLLLHQKEKQIEELQKQINKLNEGMESITKFFDGLPIEVHKDGAIIKKGVLRTEVERKSKS